MAKRKQPRKKDHEPHDAVFKAFFSDAKIARNYLLHYTSAAISRHIDFTVLEKLDTAFVNARFGISFSDVLYGTRLVSGAPARLLFLFEHKSYVPSQPIHLQLLDYLLQIWEEDLKNQRPLSFIIPIVVYHGTRGWKHRPFSEYFTGLPSEWNLFIPDFQYILTDLSRMPSQEIEEKTESEYLRNLFLALKFARNERQILENWSKILTFGKPFYRNNREGILLQTLTLYVFNLYQMSDIQVKKLNDELPEPEQNWIDAIPEIFGRRWKEEGLKKGREEGIEKGIAEGIEKGIEKGLEKGLEQSTHAFTVKMIQKFPEMRDAEIAELVGKTEDYVQQKRALQSKQP